MKTRRRKKRINVSDEEFPSSIGGTMEKPIQGAWPTKLNRGVAGGAVLGVFAGLVVLYVQNSNLWRMFSLKHHWFIDRLIDAVIWPAFAAERLGLPAMSDWEYCLYYTAYYGSLFAFGGFLWNRIGTSWTGRFLTGSSVT